MRNNEHLFIDQYTSFSRRGKYGDPPQPSRRNLGRKVTGDIRLTSGEIKMFSMGPAGNTILKQIPRAPFFISESLFEKRQGFVLFYGVVSFNKEKEYE